MMSLFISAFMLGLLFNAAPGAIFAASLRRGIAGGFMPAFQIQIGSLVGDFVWAVIGLSGAGFLFQVSVVEVPLSLAGAGLLGWLAYGSFQDARAPVPKIEPKLEPKLEPELETDKTGQADFMTGIGLSLSNPMNVSYWAGLAGTIAALGGGAPSSTAFFVFLAGFMASSVLWCFICAGFIALIQKMVNRVIWVILNLACGIGLGYFALKVVWHTL